MDLVGYISQLANTGNSDICNLIVARHETGIIHEFRSRQSVYRSKTAAAACLNPPISGYLPLALLSLSIPQKNVPAGIHCDSAHTIRSSIPL